MQVPAYSIQYDGVDPRQTPAGKASILPARAHGTHEQAVAKVTYFHSQQHHASLFERELTIHKHMLSHGAEDVVRILQNGVSSVGGVIIMEKMNCDLLDLLLEESLGGREEKLRIFAKLCLAIKNCHDNQVVHLDIKPENILTNEDASVLKLTDFGMSKFIPRDGHIVNEMCGTEIYSPPEILFELTKFVDGRAVDIWCLGIVLHVLLSLTWPYRTEKVRGLPLAEFKDLRLSQSIAKSDQTFIRSMLAFSPECRPTIDEIINSKFLKPYLPEQRSRERPSQRLGGVLRQGSPLSLVRRLFPRPLRA